MKLKRKSNDSESTTSFSNGVKDFWQELPKPFFALAPLDDVTDAAFRRIIAEYSSPNIPRVLYTEFTSADGLLLAPLESKASNGTGRRKLLKKLEFSEIERPIVAQLFTAFPEHMEQAARLVRELGFDGLDINMGCPDRAVEKSGCGADLIKHPDLARELIRAAKKGGCSCASQTCTSGKCLPVSVKTRIAEFNPEVQHPKLLMASSSRAVFSASCSKHTPRMRLRHPAPA